MSNETTAATTPTARQRSADVAIVGAGPVGLTIANSLGQAGLKVIVIEKLDTLIDYPRAIGLDDEALRTFQSVGLAQAVLPHTTPNHWMRFLTPGGRCFASIEPRTDEFGWSRRNAFVQPYADRVLYEGLARFANVEVLFSREMTGFSQDADGVTLQLEDAEHGAETIRVQYMVACDGGNSFVRRTLGVPFDGETAPNQWIVVDVRNDPIGTPNIYMCCDPVRPYVSAALPHGIRRFEFMVMPGETEEELGRPENLAKLLHKVLPNGDKLDVIRRRVYTHNARLARNFRTQRVLLAGDAAHIMPVWQGQGYNSGMRDASNLAWKLELVVKGLADAALLDSYDTERRDHARAMIDLSVLAGRIFAPKSRLLGKLRDALTLVLNAVPPVKRYFLEMRFKPMPRYTKGVLAPLGQSGATSPVGRMFIQPRVRRSDGSVCLLDDAIGPNFAVLAWGTDPTYGMSAADKALWQQLGTCFVRVVPDVQLGHLEAIAPDAPGVIRLGDVDGRLKDWFGAQSASVVFLRPDRFVAALVLPTQTSAATAELARALAARPVAAAPAEAPRKVA